MTEKAGTVKGGELWVRCPFCGDSSHDPMKAHMTINLAFGLYHCYRCRIGGRLHPNQLMGLWGAAGDISLLEPVFEANKRTIPVLIPGAGSSRASALERYHVHRQQGDGVWDAFAIRDPLTGDQIGVHLRFQKERLSLSEYRGLMWPGDSLPVSYPDQPLRIVEGPYDVLGPRDIAVLGTITARSVKPLKGHFITLCPDGDIWTKPDLLDRFMHSLKILLSHNDFPYVVGIEVYPDNKDPDELTEADRADCFITRRESQTLLKSYLAKRTKEYYNEQLHEQYFKTVGDTDDHPRRPSWIR